MEKIKMQKSSQAFAPHNGTRMKFMVHLCFALLSICNHIFAYLMWLEKYVAYFCNEFAFQVLNFGQFSSKFHTTLRPFRALFFCRILWHCQCLPWVQIRCIQIYRCWLLCLIIPQMNSQWTFSFWTGSILLALFANLHIWEC